MKFKGKLSRTDVDRSVCDNAVVVLRRISPPGGIEEWEGTLRVPSSAPPIDMTECVLATDDGRSIHLTVNGCTRAGRNTRDHAVRLNGSLG